MDSEDGPKGTDADRVHAKSTAGDMYQNRFQDQISLKVVGVYGMQLPSFPRSDNVNLYPQLGHAAVIALSDADNTG